MAVDCAHSSRTILPTLRGMEKDGIGYTGFLYAGRVSNLCEHSTRTTVSNAIDRMSFDGAVPAHEAGPGPRGVA
jgi:hypothetical protein